MRLAPLLLLAACGGGSAPEVAKIPVAPERAHALEVPAPAPVPAPQPAPPVPPPAPDPAPEPPPPPAPPAHHAPPSWVPVWGEAWESPTLGGWTRAEAGTCKAGIPDDPGTGPRTQFGVKDWTTIGGVSGITMNNGVLAIDSTQTAGGFALLSGPTFDHTKPLRVSVVIDLIPDPGAWIGLTIHNGDGNYREIGIAEHSGRLRAMLHAPCYWSWLGEELPTGPHILTIEYDDGWRMSVNGVEIYAEPIDYRKNRLTARPNIGIFVVNLTAEQNRGTSGRVRATVGPVMAWTY